MEQDEKSRFSFASIAISFFVLIVLPLTITGIVISRGVVKVGEDATQASLRILDDTQKQCIEQRAENVAEAVAQFLAGRQRDIRIAAILPRTVDAYSTFLASNTRGVLRSSDIGNVKVPEALYREIAFLDKDGMETLKVTIDGIVSSDALVDMSVPSNGAYGSEGYFIKAKGLAPGEFYMGPVTGAHVNREQVASGKTFDGIIRMATPVFDSNGFAGVVELTMNAVHLMEFTDNIVPTEPGRLFADVAMADDNYAYMVGGDGFIISHPADYLIKGIGDDMQPVETMTEDNYTTLIKTGSGAMNLREMGFMDENLPRMDALASEGKSGSLTYIRDNARIFAVYAAIPYFSGGFVKPAGFGWIGMVVDVDKYHHLSQEKVADIQEKVARWQRSSIVVVIVSLVLLFLIALILSRGIYRQILSAQKDPGAPGDYPEDEDED